MHTPGIHLRGSLPSFLLLRNTINHILHKRRGAGGRVTECDLPILKILAQSTRWRCLHNPLKTQNKGLVLLMDPGAWGSFPVGHHYVMWGIITGPWGTCSLIFLLSSQHLQVNDETFEEQRKSLCKFIRIFLCIPGTFWNGHESANIANVPLNLLGLTLKSSVLYPIVECLGGSCGVCNSHDIFSDIKRAQVFS